LLRNLLLFLLLISQPALAFQISLFIPRQNTPFWQQFVRFSQSAASELNLDLKIYNADNDAQRMLQQIESACRRGTDAIIFMNYENTGVEALELAESYRTPAFIYNTSFSGNQLAPRTSYQYWIGSITPNDTRAGKLQAEQLLALTTDNQRSGKWLAVQGNTLELSSQQRVKGLHQALSEVTPPPELILTTAGKNWSRSVAKDAFLAAYKQHPDINTVWSASDQISSGVRDAIQLLGLPEHQIKFGGIDWNPDALRHISESPKRVSVGGHLLEGAWSIVLINDYLRGLDFASYGLTMQSPMSPATMESAPIINQFFSGKAEHINFRQFSRQFNASSRYNFSIERLLSLQTTSEQSTPLSSQKPVEPTETLRVATGPDWPPVSGKPQLLAGSYSHWLAEQLSLEIEEIPFKDWQAIKSLSAQPDIDIIPFDTYEVPLHSQFTPVFSYLQEKIVIVGQTNSKLITNMSELLSHPLLLVRDHPVSQLITRYHPEADVQWQQDLTSATEQLKASPDSIMLTTIATYRELKSRWGNDHMEVVGNTPYSLSYGLAVNKAKPGLAKRITQLTSTIPTEIQLQLHRSALQQRHPPALPFRLAVLAALCATLLIALLASWLIWYRPLRQTKLAQQRELSDTRQELQSATKRLRELSATDSTTGLANDRRLQEILDREMSRAQRNRETITIMLLEPDHLSEYLQHRGYETTQTLLKQFAERLRSYAKRGSDYLFRLHSGEFVLLIYGMDRSIASEHACTIRQAILGLHQPHPTTASKQATISVGIAQMTPGSHGNELLDQAGKALLIAKQQGNNQQFMVEQEAARPQG